MADAAKLLLVFLLPCLVTAVACWLWLRFAGPWRILVPADPWHPQEVVVFGGVAIFLGTIISYCVFGLVPGTIVVLSGSGGFFALGLLDDIHPLAPRWKFGAQFVLAGASIGGLIYYGAPIPFWAIPVAVLWVLTVVNSVNLLDNMDGLVTGMGFFISLTLASIFAYLAAPIVALGALVLAGAILGFFPFNRPPARVFMGDSGSMFLGAAFALFTLLLALQSIVHPVAAIVLPLLIMYPFLLNIVFVVVFRHLEGVSISRGIADHVSYRLLGAGLSVGRVAGVFVFIAILSNLAALWTIFTSPAILPVTLGAVVVGTIYFVILLANIDVTEFRRQWGAGTKNGGTHAIFLSAGSGIQLLVDTILIPLSFYTAYIIRFEGEIPDSMLAGMPAGLLILFFVRLGALRWLNMYRFYYHFAGMQEVVGVGIAVFSSSVVLLVIAEWVPVLGISRGALVVDLVLAGGSLSISRLGVRLFRKYFQSIGRENRSRTALLIGAGSAGELFLRECETNKEYGYWVKGVLDDDSMKKGMNLHGAPVLGSIEELSSVCEQLRTDVVVLAIPSLADTRRNEIEKACKEIGIRYLVFKVGLFEGKSTL